MSAIDAPPDPHQLEISVFGPGVGECVVAHLGGGDWIVVDSCLERKSQQPVALQYLRSLGVDLANQVRLVIATHWHDDHIRGLARVLGAARTAKFVNSAAYAFKDLVRVVALGNTTAPQSSATREFAAILRILEERRGNGERREAVGPVLATANKKLLALIDDRRAVNAEVFSLSPADGVLNLAQYELRHALGTIQDRRRPMVQGPNQLCVVLWLKVGTLNVLLGADLENVTGVTEGWEAIIASAERPSGRAIAYKVSHHGSENGDCPNCWTDLLSSKPIAIVTPYGPSMLPKPADVRRLCDRTPQVFLTSDPSRYGVPRRDNAVEKTLRELTMTRRALSGQMGHVQLRCDAKHLNAEPQVLLENGARRQCA